MKRIHWSQLNREQAHGLYKSLDRLAPDRVKVSMFRNEND